MRERLGNAATLFYIGRPPAWYFLPALMIGTGNLFAWSLAPYASGQRRLLVLAGLVALTAVLVVLARRVDRAGFLRTRGMAALAALAVLLTGFSVAHQLDRRINRGIICQQVTAPVSTAADLKRIQRGTIGEYVEAGPGYVPAARGGGSLSSNALGLGTEAFVVEQAVRQRPGARTTAAEQERLRSQQAALAGSCR